MTRKDFTTYAPIAGILAGLIAIVLNLTGLVDYALWELAASFPGGAVAYLLYELLYEKVLSRSTLAYGALLAGAFSFVTLSLIEDHPVALAASFPVGALTFVVVWLAAGWRPRRGRS